MKLPHSWREVLAEQGVNQVPPVRALRNGNADFFQFITRANIEVVAVHAPDPYGSLTEMAFTEESDLLHLLHAIEAADDYVAFEVSRETIALKAISLGTGRRRAHLLQPVYENVGRSVAEMSEAVGVPILGLADFAIIRSTGDVVFVPPVSFGVETYPAEVVVEGLAQSLNLELGQLFPPDFLITLEQGLYNGQEQ